MQSVQLPPLHVLRELGVNGLWRARLALEDGRIEEAIDDCLAVPRVGRHWQKPTDVFIAQLMGVAISQQAHQEILRILADRDVPAALLRRTQEQLQELYPNGYPLISPAAEKLFFADIVQRTFTEGGLGGGHVIPEALPRVLDHWGPRQEWDAKAKVAYTLLGIAQVRRNETLEKANALYDLAIELSQKTPYERQTDMRNTGSMIMQLPRWRHMVLHSTVPFLDETGTMSYRALATYEAAITVLALQRYRAEHGQYPQTLDALVNEGLLKQVPKDPYSPGPLIYRRVADDFTLYSVASNFADNGGTRIQENGWQPDSKGSDHVFWPVSTEQVKQDGSQ